MHVLWYHHNATVLFWMKTFHTLKSDSEATYAVTTQYSWIIMTAWWHCICLRLENCTTIRYGMFLHSQQLQFAARAEIELGNRLQSYNVCQQPSAFVNGHQHSTFLASINCRHDSWCRLAVGQQ